MLDRHQSPVWWKDTELVFLAVRGGKMKNDFWDALINGLTPESPDDVQIWWKVPLFIMVVGLTLAILS